jgi:hypothetical protein
MKNDRPLSVIPDAAERRSGIHNACATDFTLRVMDSGFALRAPRNDSLQARSALP